MWLWGIEPTFFESNSKSVCLAKELCTVLIWEWMTELSTFKIDANPTQYLTNPDPKHNIYTSFCYLVWIWKRESFHSSIKRPTELFQLLFRRAVENIPVLRVEEHLQGWSKGDCRILDVHQHREDGLGRAGVVDHLHQNVVETGQTSRHQLHNWWVL